MVSPSTGPNWRERSGRWANSRRTGFPFTSAKWFATSTLPGSSPQWFDDTWSVLDDLRSGWVLWNFRGPFGVLDTQRAGTKFEDCHGHQLNRALHALLQKKMKEWRAIDHLAGMLSSAYSAACVCELSGSKVLAGAEAQAYRPNARNEFSAWPTTSVGMAYNPPASRSPAGASAFAVVT